MNMESILNRRELIRGAALVPIGVSLAACGVLAKIESQPVSQAFVTAAGYLTSIVQAVVGEVPVIAAKLGLSTTSGPLADLLNYANELGTVASTIAGSTVSTTAQSALQTAEGIIQSIVAGLSALKLTGTAGSIVSAINTVLPIIEALVNGLVGARADAPDVGAALNVLRQAAAGAP
jgi:hypothetical protein